MMDLSFLKEVGRHMAKSRHQRGWVEECGKRVRKWRGHFYVYLRAPDGTERRAHRAVFLGLKSELKKWRAEAKLQTIIERETGGNGPAKPDGAVTFDWFWHHRYLPLKEGTWRRSTRETVISVVKTHFLPRFGETKLCDLSRFDLQTHLNRLAAKHSHSAVQKIRTWVKAALDEAVEQEFLPKSPARRLDMPATRPTSKRYLSPEEITSLLSALSGRSRLVVRLLILCALRPGELFALRWRSVEPGRLRVEAAVYRGRLGETKTEVSNGYVALPKSLEEELAMWRQCWGNPSEDEFIFRSRTGTPLDGHNLLRRVLQPAARKAGIKGLTFQCLRRSFATHLQGLGTVKDAQAQLRYADASTTMNVYAQAIPASVRAAVEALDNKLCGVLNTTEQRFQM